MDFENDSFTWIEDSFTGGERGTTLGDPALAEVEVTTEGLGAI